MEYDDISNTVCEVEMEFFAGIKRLLNDLNALEKHNMELDVEIVKELREHLQLQLNYMGI